MIELPVKNAELSTTFSGTVLKVEVPTNLRALTENFLLAMKEEKTYKLILQEEKKDRSLTQNAYFHAIVGEIAKVTKQSNDEVKRELVLRYGTIDRDESGKYIGFMLLDGISPESIFPYCKRLKSQTIDGKTFVQWLCFKRTHEMDSTEFSRLIDGTVSEANDLGIQTMTPEEIARLEL